MSEIVAFTAEHVCRLTGLSRRQLRYWDATEFFSPTVIPSVGRQLFGHIYTFRDVVGLRAIAILRNKHQVPLQELRRVGEWLSQHYEHPWSSLRLFLSGRRISFADPETGVVMEARHGRQRVIPVALQAIADDMGNAADKLRERRDEEIGKISRNRYVVHNAWVVAGTRVPTAAVWNFHKAGYNAAAIVEEYPRLTPQDVQTAIEFEEARHKTAA